MINVPNEYHVKCLMPEHIAAYHELLRQDTSGFVKKRSAAALEAHLSAPMPIIGVFYGRRLVAAALLTYPKYLEATEYLEGYPLTGTSAILQSVIAARGHKGMLARICDVARDLAEMKGYTEIIAKVRGDNNKAQSSFLCQNFHRFGSMQADPLGGAFLVQFMRQKMGWDFMSAAQCAEAVPRAINPPGCQFRTEEPPQAFQPVHTG